MIASPVRKIMTAMAVFMIAVALAVSTARSQDTSPQLPNPYEIVNRNYTAIGGLDKLKAQHSMHAEGELVLVGTGLQGTISDWSQDPVLARQEVDLKVLKQISGDNGEHAWTIDHNGKLEIRNDEQTLKQRRLRILMADFEHINPASNVFSLTCDRIDTAFGTPCYVVTVHNTINKDVTSDFYDTTSFMLLRSIHESPEGTNTTWFSDYRDVDGVLFAFHQGSIEDPSGMKTEVTFTTVEANVAIDPAMFEPPQEDVADFHFTNGKSAEGVAFQFLESHIFLPVTVGGKTRLWVLDSGAGATVIDKEFAEELGLTIEGQVKGQGVAHQVDVSFATLPDLSVPGLVFEPQTAAVIALRSMFDRWIGMQVDGILGYDFLSRLVTKVDYAHEELSFYLPDSFHYAGDGVAVPAPLSQSNLPELPITVDGVHGGMWSLDLGAGGMSYHYQYAKDNGLLDRPGVEAVGRGAGGSHPEKRILTDSIAMAGYTVKNIESTVPVEQGAGAFGYTELTGNIGNTFLRHFVLYLDYKHEQVIVEKGADFGRDFPRDNSGLQLEHASKDSLQVIFVAPNTPAADAGLQTGDIITSIDGTDVATLGGIIGASKLLRGQPGTTLAIDIARRGETKKVSLTLRDLFE